MTDAAQLRAAFDGAYGVFAVTTGLEIFELKKEFEQGALVKARRNSTLHCPNCSVQRVDVIS